MIEAVFLCLLLFVFAYFATRFLPEPVGMLVAVVCVLLALWVLVGASDLRLD